MLSRRQTRSRTEAAADLVEERPTPLLVPLLIGIAALDTISIVLTLTAH